MTKPILLLLGAALSVLLASSPVLADVGSGSAANVQEGDNEDESDQDGESESGDAIAGQVVGVQSSGDASVDATNTTRNSSAESGDAEAENVALTFVGNDGGGGTTTAADVSSGAAGNVQEGDNSADINQATQAVSGDAVAGQIGGVVTSASGTADVVIANTTIDSDVSSGDVDAGSFAVSIVGGAGAGGSGAGGLALVISNASGFEGDTLVFRVSLVAQRSAADAADARTQRGQEQPPNGGVCFTYETSDGTAEAESDYAPTSGGDCIPPGSTSTTVSVGTVADKDCEGTEHFQVDLTSSQGATIADGTGTGTIGDCGI